MNITHLHIDAFGHFRDFSLELSDTINVIHGPNEAGKSTIHAFIEGMLYGFIDPRKKKRKRFAVLDRYIPRDTDAFGGTMHVNHEGKEYRIERSFKEAHFKRKAPSVRVYEASTGKEITHTIPKDPTTKEADLAQFFDLPYMLYRNTLSIDQIDPAPSSDAADALITRLQSLQSSMGETLSVEKAKAALDAKLKAIGGDNAPTKPYAKTKQIIKTLKDEHEEASARDETINALGDTIETLTNDKARHERTLAEKHTTLKRVKNDALKARHTTLKNLHETITTEVKNAGGTPPTSVDEWMNLRHPHQSLFDTLEKDYRTYAQAAQTIDSCLASAPSKDTQLSPRAYARIQGDAKRLEAFEAQIDPTAPKTLQTQINALSAEEEKITATLRKLSHQRTLTTLILTTLMLIISGVSSFLFMPIGFVAFASLIIPLAMWGVFTHIIKKQTHQLNATRETLSAKDKALKRQEKQHTQAHFEIKTLVERYGASSAEEFRAYVHNAAFYHENFIKARELATTIHRARATLHSVSARVRPLFDALNLPVSESAFEVLSTINPSLRTMTGYLHQTTFTELENAIDHSMPSGGGADQGTLEETIQTLERDIRGLEQSIALKQQTLNQTAALGRPLSVIEHDLQTHEASLAAYEARKRVLQGALGRLEDAGARIEASFAPALSEHIAAALSTLSGETYDTIKVRKDFTFSVESPVSKTLEHAEHFSRGTLDQIHFAIRLGMLKALGKEHYPLFIDDAFVNYDDARLSGTLEMLKETSKQRQILLFTCQKREHTMLGQFEEAPTTIHLGKD